MSYLIYLRKSRKDVESFHDSEEDILSRHERILTSLAEKQQLTVGAVYREVVSGDSISGRPFMKRLLQEVETGLWDGVLVVEVERLARGDTIDQGVVQRAFQYSGTRIITPAKTYDPSDEFDQEYFEFSLFMSRREYKTIKRRMQSGRYAAAAEGKWPFNTAPYGYRRVRLRQEKGWTLEFDEREKAVGECIYRLVAERGFGISEVRDYLNSRGIRPRKSDRWTDSTLRDFLRNPANDGMVFIGKRKVVNTLKNGVPVASRPRNPDCLKAKGLHPPLVPHDLYLAAQRRIGSGMPRTSYTIKNPLAGLVYCDACGHAMQRRPGALPDGSADFLICKTPGCRTVGSPLCLVERELISLLSTAAGADFSAICSAHAPAERNRLFKQAVRRVLYRKTARNKKGEGTKVSFDLIPEFCDISAYNNGAQTN